MITVKMPEDRIRTLQLETQAALNEAKRRHLAAWKDSYTLRAVSLAKLMRRKLGERNTTSRLGTVG